jgi:NAD(P)-dependent dehydrogenase (short-subunit alcohol dehydrogenase family)
MGHALKDRVALVTGSAHRVGKAIALTLALEGASIVVHYYQSEDAAKNTVKEIKSLGVDAIAVHADQSDPNEVQAMLDTVRDHHGRLDILVNSASMFKKSDFLAVSHQEWKRLLDVNLTGPFLCSQYAARMMMAQEPPGGTIINILDNIGRQPWPDFPHHSVAKSGLLMLSQVMARSLSPQIRVNAVVPGHVLKPPNLPEEQWNAFSTHIPLRRPGTAEDVGRAVTFLASEDFINGAILGVDGGEWLTNFSGNSESQATNIASANSIQETWNDR